MEFLFKFVGEQLTKLIVKLKPKQYAWVSVLLTVLGIASLTISQFTYDDAGQTVELTKGITDVVLTSISGIVTAALAMLNIDFKPAGNPTSSN